MKNLFSFSRFSSLLMACFLVLGIFTSQSCKKEDPDERIQFIASYSATESCSGSAPFNLNITASSLSEEEVLIQGFAGISALTVRAIVSGNNLTIQNQSHNVNNVNLTISGGNGNLAGANLTMTYTWAVGADSGTCTINGAKQ